jgi:hypothetical protein
MKLTIEELKRVVKSGGVISIEDSTRYVDIREMAQEIIISRELLERCKTHFLYYGKVFMTKPDGETKAILDAIDALKAGEK